MDANLSILLKWQISFFWKKKKYLKPICFYIPFFRSDDDNADDRSSRVTRLCTYFQQKYKHLCRLERAESRQKKCRHTLRKALLQAASREPERAGQLIQELRRATCARTRLAFACDCSNPGTGEGGDGQSIQQLKCWTLKLVGTHKAEKTWHINACQWSKINMAYSIFHEDKHFPALHFKMWIVCSAVSGPDFLNVTKEVSGLLKFILIN